MLLKHGAALVIFIHEHSNRLGASKSGLDVPFQSLLSNCPAPIIHPSPGSKLTLNLHIFGPCLVPFSLSRMTFLLVANLSLFQVASSWPHSWRSIPQCPGVQFVPPSSLPLSPRFTLLVSGLALLCLLLCLPPVPKMGCSDIFALAWPAPFHPSGIGLNVISSARPSWTI